MREIDIIGRPINETRTYARTQGRRGYREKEIQSSSNRIQIFACACIYEQQETYSSSFLLVALDKISVPGEMIELN